MLSVTCMNTPRLLFRLLSCYIVLAPSKAAKAEKKAHRLASNRFILSLPELECAFGHALAIYGDLENYVGGLDLRDLQDMNNHYDVNQDTNHDCDIITHNAHACD